MQIAPLRRNANWIVVADDALAVIYAQKKKRGPVMRVTELTNEDGRKKTGDLLSDRGGRSFDSHGQGRHTMAKEKSDPKTQVAARFAKEISQRINKALREGACGGYALIAAPGFLGLLRDAVETAVTQGPFLTIDKDVVRHDAAAIERLLAEKQ